MALHARFAAVRGRIDKAAAASGRRAEAVTLVAVSKMHPAEAVAALLPAWKRGKPVFGENYVQEALQKQDGVAALLQGAPGAPPCPEWHCIGHVQSRKARDIAGRFALIHTLDSEKLALAIRKAVVAENLPPQAVLVQINIGREAQKSGLLPENAEKLLETVMPMREIRLDGLMCLPPFGENAEDSRPHFAAMRELRDKLARLTGLALPHLSMGMSHDCEVAVSEGATMVRVGTDIFGPRAPGS
jgi:pyridoxal phosphate enzyme (YggS family)